MCKEKKEGAILKNWVKSDCFKEKKFMFLGNGKNIMNLELVYCWSINGDEKYSQSNILEQCGMWNMINVFEPPMGNRSQKDSMDVLTKIPIAFIYMWLFIILISVTPLTLAILKCLTS